MYSTTHRVDPVTLPSESHATAAATGTAVVLSAAITLYSRTISCAEDVSPDNGGRRTTQADCSSLTLNVKLDRPPASAVTTSSPCTSTPLSISSRRNRRVSIAVVVTAYLTPHCEWRVSPAPNDAPPKDRRRYETAGLRAISAPPADPRILPALHTFAYCDRRP